MILANGTRYPSISLWLSRTSPESRFLGVAKMPCSKCFIFSKNMDIPESYIPINNRSSESMMKIDGSSGWNMSFDSGRKLGTSSASSRMMENNIFFRRTVSSCVILLRVLQVLFKLFITSMRSLALDVNPSSQTTTDTISCRTASGSRSI